MSFSAEIPFSKIFLFIDSSIENIEERNLKEFLEKKTGREVQVENDFLKKKNREGLAEEIAETKVRDKRERKFKEPLPKEIEIEKKVIEEERDLLGIIYDGHRLVKLFRDLLDQEEKDEHTVIITKRLVGSLEKNESRYHIRAIINSIPSIISVSGIVEGPAKPRKYYFADEDEKEDVLDFEPMRHSDERMENAVRSYLLHTIFWRLDGYPFCEKEGCALKNSHWQRDVIQNLVDGGLCEEHSKELKLFKEKKRG